MESGKQRIRASGYYSTSHARKNTITIYTSRYITHVIYTLIICTLYTSYTIMIIIYTHIAREFRAITTDAASPSHAKTILSVRKIVLPLPWRLTNVNISNVMWRCRARCLATLFVQSVQKSVQAVQVLNSWTLNSWTLNNIARGHNPQPRNLTPERAKKHPENA